MGKEQSVKVTKQQSHKDGVEIRDLLKSTLMLITKAKREENKESILRLCELLGFKGVEEFITQDARALRWANRSEEEVSAIKQRQALKAQQYVKKHNEALKQARAELKVQRDKKYKVEWRGQGSEVFTLIGAAKIVGISEHALRLRLHKSKTGLAAFNIDDQVVTVYKPKS